MEASRTLIPPAEGSDLIGHVVAASGPHLETIRSDSGLQRLLQGFQKARLVTFVGEPQTILGLFGPGGFESVELVISENFHEVKDRIEYETLRQLGERVLDGSLRVFVPRPKNKIHTKLYILERPGRVRVIFTSRNLYSSRSLDFAIWYDLPVGHVLAREAQRLYDEHLEACVPFFGDLFERARTDPSAERQILEAFLAEPETASEAVPTIIAETTRAVIENPDLEVLKIQIPDSPRQRKRLEAELSKSGFSVSESEGIYRVDSRQFRTVVSRRVELPVMVVDRSRGTVSELIDGEVLRRSSPPPSPEEVDAGLRHIEDYLSTIEAEKAPELEKRVHETALFEVLLYLFASPFSHELMRLMQHHYGLVQKRGPRFLLIHGQTHRGKTTFLAFVLSLIAGRRIDPLSAKSYFKEGFIRQAIAFRTTFPLIFDDMLTVASTQFEGVVKDYWEKNWNSTDPVPQLVFSANRSSIRPSVVTRVKKVYFPVYIEPTPEKKKVLNQLREREVSNHLFEWFASVYLDLLNRQQQPPPDDELFLSRTAMKSLYDYAHRAVPPYFPGEPFERLYDSSRAEWHDVIYGLKKAEVRDGGDRILVEFHKDMGREEVLPYAAILPLTMDYEVKGNTIIVNSADRFRQWLPLVPLPGPTGMSGSPPPRTGFANRLRRLVVRQKG